MTYIDASYQYERGLLFMYKYQTIPQIRSPSNNKPTMTASSTSSAVASLPYVAVCLVFTLVYYLKSQWGWILTHWYAFMPTNKDPLFGLLGDPRKGIPRQRQMYVRWLGHKPLAMFTRARDVKDAIDTDVEYRRPVGMGCGDLFHRFMRGGIGLANERWLLIKRAFQPALGKMHSEAKSQDIYFVAVSQWIDETLQSAADSEEPISGVDVASKLVYRVVHDMYFGVDFVNKHFDLIMELAQHSTIIASDCVLNNAARFSAYRLLPTKLNRRLNEFNKGIEHLMDLYDAVPENEKEGLLAKVKRDLITRTEYVHTVVEIVFLNQDILIPTMAWLMVHMALYADQLVPQEGETEEEVAERFLLESGRLSPVMAMSFPGESTKAIYGFPKGMNFARDLNSILRDDEYWANPNEFNAERFRGDEVPDYIYPRFGIGKVKCPGRYLANAMLSRVCIAVNSRYKVRLTGDYKHSDEIPVLLNKPFPTPDVKTILEKR